MRCYVYLIGFIVSVILAVVGGIAFRFLEIDNERETAEDAFTQLQELLGYLVTSSVVTTLAFDGGSVFADVCLSVCSFVCFSWSPYGIGQTIIFLPCDFYLLLSFFFLASSELRHVSTIGKKTR